MLSAESWILSHLAIHLLYGKLGGVYLGYEDSFSSMRKYLRLLAKHNVSYSTNSFVNRLHQGHTQETIESFLSGCGYLCNNCFRISAYGLSSLHVQLAHISLHEYVGNPDSGYRRVVLRLPALKVAAQGNIRQ